jgi:histidinol-phosphate aminotransferase
MKTVRTAPIDDLVARGFTRRHLLRVAALVGAGATALPLGGERALAQLSNAGPIPDDAVKINANEFPEGPSERALAALAEAARRGNRYQ